MQALVTSVLEETVDASTVAIKVGPLPAISGDPILLRQVWVNLIANAVKFSARAEKPVIAIDARTDNGEVVFRVTDNGVGFDPAYAGKLFGMFQRLHAATDFEGTGVGLATVRRIVERHGGRVAANAGPQGGACFEFALPAWRVLDKARG
jgi:light-regulated signal transduction histidine kinase (bacteriophytochrome)